MKLIVQPATSTTHPRAGLAGIKILNPDAATLSHYQQQPVDCALLPESLTLDSLGLFVMDMDSTLITIECIDEIADMQGIKAEVAAITERSMRGEIDFNQSLQARVALLAGLDAAALQAVYDERLQLTQGAEILLKTLHEHQVYTLLVSGGFTFFTDRLKQQLGLSAAYSNTLEIIDGKLTGQIIGPIVDAQAKVDYLKSTQQQLGLRDEQVIAIGDGANDIPMLQAAGFGIAFHGKPKVQSAAKIVLNYTGLDGILALLT